MDRVSASKKSGAIVVALALLISSHALAQATAMETYVTINPTGENTTSDGLRITMSTTGSFQVVRNGSENIYFDATPELADSFLFVKINGTVYASGNGLTQVSQTGVTGTGTVATPWRVVTVLAAGFVPVTVTTDYVLGDPFFNLKVDVDLTDGSATTTVYWGLDSLLAGGDNGSAYSILRRALPLPWAS